MANYLSISWWNDHDLGDIVYQNGFKNKIYLDVEVEKPEYNTTIESDLNGDAVEIAKFRKWEKVYRFEAWMQEDLVDAFTLMQIHDNIEVTLQSGDVIQVAKHGLRCEPAWEEIGCLAKCVVSFAENYIVAGNCDENLYFGCRCSDPGTIIGIRPVASLSSLSPSSGDYAIGYTVENIADKNYTGSLYQYIGSWNTVVNPEQYSCYYNEEDLTNWIWDGQYWHLYPGYIDNITNAGADITVTGWVLPGAFVTVYMDVNAIPGAPPWTVIGNYTADELQAGIVITVAPPAFASLYLKVWNHSCNYGNTEVEGFIF
jgi:hypothetical protein